MMTIKSWTAALAAAAMLAPLQDVGAQTFEDSAGGRAAQVSVGVRIPFGAQSKRDQTPEMQLTLDRKRVGEMEWQSTSTSTSASFGERRAPKATRLSLSLDGEKRLALNGREFSTPESRRNLSDGAAIGIGVAVGVAALVAVAFASGGDELSDDDCFIFCEP